jgi:hypothetical protein
LQADSSNNSQLELFLTSARKALYSKAIIDADKAVYGIWNPSGKRKADCFDFSML